MRLSEHLTDLIRAGLRAPNPSSDGHRPPQEAARRWAAVTGWFCPRCAAVLPVTGSHLECRSCGYLLTWAQRYALIESHPHSAWPPVRHTLLDHLRINWSRVAHLLLRGYHDK